MTTDKTPSALQPGSSWGVQGKIGDQIKMATDSPVRCGPLASQCGSTYKRGAASAATCLGVYRGQRRTELERVLCLG